MASSASSSPVSQLSLPEYRHALISAKAPRCYLLELPAELRNHMYEYVFDSHSCIDLEARGDKRPLVRQKLQQRHSLLATCKQIRNEGEGFAQALPVVRYYVPVVEERKPDSRHDLLTPAIQDLETLAQAGLLQRGRIIFCFGKVRFEPRPTSFEDMYRYLHRFRIKTRFIKPQNYRVFFDMRLQNGLTARIHCGFDHSTFLQEVKQAILFCGDIVTLNEAEELHRYLLETVVNLFWLRTI